MAPFGALVEVMVRAGAMVMLSDCVTDCWSVPPPESTAFMEKGNVPLDMGVPVMAHVEGFRLRPPGKVPELTENV